MSILRSIAEFFRMAFVPPKCTCADPNSPYHAPGRCDNDSCSPIYDDRGRVVGRLCARCAKHAVDHGTIADGECDGGL